MFYYIYFTIQVATVSDIEVELPGINFKVPISLNLIFQMLSIGCLEQLSQKLAKEIEKDLLKSIRQLKKHPERYRAYENPDGQDVLSGCIYFLERFYEVCQKYPYATIRVDLRLNLYNNVRIDPRPYAFYVD